MKGSSHQVPLCSSLHPDHASVYPARPLPCYHVTGSNCHGEAADVHICNVSSGQHLHRHARLYTKGNNAFDMYDDVGPTWLHLFVGVVVTIVTLPAACRIRFMTMTTIHCHAAAQIPLQLVVTGEIKWHSACYCLDDQHLCLLKYLCMSVIPAHLQQLVIFWCYALPPLPWENSRSTPGLVLTVIAELFNC